MPPDCYKIEIIHYLNPHLIWIEVRDPSVLRDEFLFEQIGVYGVLPLEKTLDIMSENLVSQKCEEWLPASVVVMKDFFDQSTEVWFSLIHFDRGASIFDDQIHRYGDIIIKTKSGKVKELSKHLLKSGFAYDNNCEFHERLSCGKLKTKLDIDITKKVITELENYYIRKDKPRNNWKNSVEKQTTVFQLSHSFDESLRVSNLEKQNNMDLNQMLTNKYKSFELCKDIEEPSQGRACGRIKSRNSIGGEGEKLRIPTKTHFTSKITSNSQKTGDLKNTYNDVNNFLCSNSNDTLNQNQYQSTINTPSENQSNVKKENILSRKMKPFKKLEKATMTMGSQLENQKPDENTCVNGIPVEEGRLYEYKKSKNKNTMQNLNHGNQYQEQSRENRFQKQNIDSRFQEDNAVTHKTSRRPVQPMRAQESQIAFGPAGMNYKYFKVVTAPDYAEYEEEKMEQKYDSKVGSKKHDRLYGDVDSEVDDEITNTRTVYELKNRNINDSKKTVDKVKSFRNIDKVISNEEELTESRVEIKNNGSVTNLKSSLMKGKLKTYYSAGKHNSSFSSTDTSIKDSSSDVTLNKESHGDDEIKHVIERLSLKYKNDIASKQIDAPTNKVECGTKLKNNVNPFKNIDPAISVFVDKLITPVLMLHSKHDIRIEPVFDMKSVYFNNHIHCILKNHSIERPMTMQTVSWFAILRGYSLYMISPMGSGKTIGYLPAVCRLVDDSKSLTRAGNGPVCIIVCATAQSVANVEKFAKLFVESKEKVLGCYAGVDNMHITTRLLNGCDLLICTPPALLRLLQTCEFSVDLKRLSTFVLDDCERLSEVYADEIKFFNHSIKELLKTRSNKELKVQYIIASRIWCDFMGPLATKNPDTVISIGAFQECVLYSKTNASVALVKKENKLESVLEFMKDIDTSKKTVIVCQTNDEIEFLVNALKRCMHIVLTGNNDMTIHDLYNLNVSWADFGGSSSGPILVCCDGNLAHMNITDAHNLIHYSMPPLYSVFCKRFSVLNDNYPSIFKTDNVNVKIKILLEENNVEQLPKILNFIKRCTDNVPSVLNELASNILAEKDVIKAKKYYPICDNLLTLGYCPDIYNCQERHTILKDYDSPKNWLPKEGIITCKILHYHSATLYSAKLLSCTADGKTTKYPQTYSNLSMKLGLYYSKESNKKLHGIPEIGDICTISQKVYFYARCQVLKILSRCERGNPSKVLVKLIDEEKLEVTRDIYLYHLPKEYRDVESQVVHVRLANIKPRDNDITFSDLARDRLKSITDREEELFVRGKVCLTLGNCIFVNTLEGCEDFTSLNEVVVKYNLMQQLLENHAIPNPNHMLKLEKLCTENGLHVKKETNVQKSIISIKNLPTGTWAHLECNSFSTVFFASAINPDKFFVRLCKFESCMVALLKDIKKHVDSNPTRCDNVKEGEIVLAKFPDDDTYERARIDCIKEDAAKCFFVDQGDWRDILLHDLIPITQKLIEQLPFQAIECRLVGIRPVGEQWTDFSSYWFIDNCNNDNGDLKYLFVKYFTKEPAEFTNGHKYSVAVIDTNKEQDVILNQLMIDLNLAQEIYSELKYLDGLEINKPEQKPSSDTEDLWDDLVTSNNDLENDNKYERSVVHTSQSNTLLGTPLRSVPLINSDNESDDSDKWDINFGDNHVTELFPALKDLKNLNVNTPKVKVNALKSPELAKKNKAEKVIELDSDDLTSPDNTFEMPEEPNKEIDAIPEAMENTKPEKVEKRRPKIIWQQNKTSVTVKIQLIGADNYQLIIDDRVLHFTADVQDTEYEFELELYGIVNKGKCSHTNKGQYILVRLTKVLAKHWLTLTRDGAIKKWISYDVDSIDASSAEETVDDHIKDIVKDIHNRVDSDTDDDEMNDADRYNVFE